MLSAASRGPRGSCLDGCNPTVKHHGRGAEAFHNHGQLSCCAGWGCQHCHSCAQGKAAAAPVLLLLPDTPVNVLGQAVSIKWYSKAIWLSIANRLFLDANICCCSQLLLVGFGLLVVFLKWDKWFGQNMLGLRGKEFLLLCLRRVKWRMA